jgi:hypothetical protein
VSRRGITDLHSGASKARPRSLLREMNTTAWVILLSTANEGDLVRAICVGQLETIAQSGNALLGTEIYSANVPRLSSQVEIPRFAVLA